MRLPFSTRFVLLCTVALLSALPMAFGYYINATSPAPTEQRLATRCSRYCERYGCPHATPTNSPAYFRLRPLYVATIKGLAAGGKKLYATANIVIYVVLIPLLLMGLIYGALRNALLIHRLKLQLRG
jgi:hypothetical protein